MEIYLIKWVKKVYEIEIEKKGGMKRGSIFFLGKIRGVGDENNYPSGSRHKDQLLGG